MKTRIIIALICSIASVVAMAGSLNPQGHPLCTGYPGNNVQCNNDSAFYFDQIGRCGCVPAQEVLSPETCQNTPIGCNEAKGETYSLLFSYTDMATTPVYHGCGCFNDNPSTGVGP